MISMWDELFTRLDPDTLLTGTTSDDDVNRRRLDELTRGAIWPAYLDRLVTLRGAAVDSSPVGDVAPAHQVVTGFAGLVLDFDGVEKPGGRVVSAPQDLGTWRERWLVDDKDAFMRPDRMKVTFEQKTEHANIGAEGVAKLAAGIYPHTLRVKADGGLGLELATDAPDRKTWRATMDFSYDGMPSTSEIKAIDPPGPGAVRTLYRVRRQFAGGFPSPVGHMYREVLPSSSTVQSETVVDHWTLSADFKAIANPGDVLLLDRLTKTGEQPTDTEAYLLDAQAAGMKYYVQIIYTLQPA